MQRDSYSLPELAGLLRRRAKVIGISLLLFPLLAIVAAYSLDTLYKSSGTIIIELPEASASFLPGSNQSADREQRISRIYDEVMTRDNIAEIIDRRGLYKDLRDEDGSPNSVVGELRSRFDLEFILAQNDPRNKNLGEVMGFELSFFHQDPKIARDVTRDIVDLFLQGNRARRQEAYFETAAALEREADNLRRQVSVAEGLLAEFKTRNPGALPEDRNYNRQIVERKSNDLNDLEREIRSLQERKTLFQSQLAQTDPWTANIGADGLAMPSTSERLRQLQGEYLRLLGNYNATHPDVLKLRREIESLTGGTSNPAFRQLVESELTMKRVELRDARVLYGEDHPDIRNLERAVASLESQVAAMPQSNSEELPPNNPAYINIELQLKGVDTELGALKFNRQRLQAEIRDLDNRVQVAPEVEREYLDLTRDLGLARKQYEDIRSRQMSVERAGELENEELAERYVVTRVPVLPFAPAYPNRPLFFIIGVFLGFTFAVVLAIGTEAFDGTIRSTRDIRTILGMPPIAAIPFIATASDVRHHKISRFMFTLGVLASVAAVAAYVQLQRAGAI